MIPLCHALMALRAIRLRGSLAMACHAHVGTVLPPGDVQGWPLTVNDRRVGFSCHSRVGCAPALTGHPSGDARWAIPVPQVAA